MLHDMSYIPVYQTWSLHETRKTRPRTEADEPPYTQRIAFGENQSFASYLQLLRVRAGLTIQKLSEATGVVATHISSYERGDEDPDDDTARRIIAALQMYPANGTTLSSTLVTRDDTVCPAGIPGIRSGASDHDVSANCIQTRQQ